MSVWNTSILLIHTRISMPVLEFTNWWVYLNFHIFYLSSQVSYLASERTWKSHSYSFEERLLCYWDSIKGRKLLFIYFYFGVFIYFCNYVLRCWYIFTFSENGAYCSSQVLFIGLFVWYLIFLNHIRWLYKVMHC